MVIGTLIDDIARRVEGAGAALGSALFEPVVRLGVTGLSGAGKTVFITALVAGLVARTRMGGLAAVAKGRLEAAYLQPQPDDTIPRFDYETHLAGLAAPEPRWPDSTRAVSQLRLSLRLRSGGLLGGIAGARIVHLDIVDYPGEWLLDLGLMDRDYATWSREALARVAEPARAAHAGPWRAAEATADPAASFEEAQARALAEAWTQHLHSLRAAGLAGAVPGRFLLPGDLAGSPVLTFAPLPRPERVRRGTLWAECERRYDAYRRDVVRPFFRDHLARIDRQIVLADVLGALHSGPAALDDLRAGLAGVLAAFRPGPRAWLPALTGRRVERILFAATKADHLHHRQHPQLTAIVEALVAEARTRADFAGARTGAMAIAALRATVEETRRHEGADLPCVRGILAETGRPAVFYPGALPDSPAELLGPAREGAARWLEAEFGQMRFAPPRLDGRPGEGPPHIRLDRAAEFLFGDRL